MCRKVRHMRQILTYCVWYNLFLVLRYYPSETSCKQDLCQDTRYRNVNRSWKFRYNIVWLSCTKIVTKIFHYRLKDIGWNTPIEISNAYWFAWPSTDVNQFFCTYRSFYSIYLFALLWISWTLPTAENDVLNAKSNLIKTKWILNQTKIN